MRTGCFDWPANNERLVLFVCVCGLGALCLFQQKCAFTLNLEMAAASPERPRDAFDQPPAHFMFASVGTSLGTDAIFFVSASKLSGKLHVCVFYRPDVHEFAASSFNGRFENVSFAICWV